MNNIICIDIISVTEEGAILKHKNGTVFIDFDFCAMNYAKESFRVNSKCIAFRDVTKCTFTFFTEPKTNIIFKNHYLKMIFGGKSATGLFLDLQKAINQYGYTSYDMS